MRHGQKCFRAPNTPNKKSQTIYLALGGRGQEATWLPSSVQCVLMCSPPTDKYAIRFIPHENGVHSIDVRFNGRHIPGSPFKIRVGEQSQAGDPGLVTAYGPGLEGGTTGKVASDQFLFLSVLGHQGTLQGASTCCSACTIAFTATPCPWMSRLLVALSCFSYIRSRAATGLLESAPLFPAIYVD